MNQKAPDTGTCCSVRQSCETKKADVTIDVCGLQCPGPIMKLKEAVDLMAYGQILKISASDPGFLPDAIAWCQTTGNRFISADTKEGRLDVYLEKGAGELSMAGNRTGGDGKSIIVFSGDLDKVMAAFIIANGAAAMAKPVTMFFTFWGLNALRKAEGAAVQKGFMDKMFGWMMPRGAGHLTLSKMHMAGMGTAMMKMVMKNKNVSSVEELIGQAKKAGIKLIACAMSMDVMGIKKEELIDGVEIGGVATFLSTAENANMNLFI